ncbi:MAG: 4-alpha-glucanotransferase [Planctomycetota bacterium]
MRPPALLAKRSAGLLLHPTSLPGRHGCGDLGVAARAFVDFLAAAGMRWWQMLPVGPTGHSPYSALSAFAGNPLLIDLDALAAVGLLAARDLVPPPGLSDQEVVFGPVTEFRVSQLRRAFAAFERGGGLRQRDFRRFCAREAGWLADHALYMALRRQHARGASTGEPCASTGEPSNWITWPPALRTRRPAALRRAAADLRTEVDFERFVQFLFDQQWSALRRYAGRRGIRLIGDVPFFVAHDSSDVWAHPDLFDLDERGRARTVSGAPPDYFSRTGQLWNHPQYRWRRHAATGFDWWLARFGRAFALFDAVRIDHFLGFNRVWAVPGRAKTARRGKWVKTPGAALFARLQRKLGPLPIIAEDLGLLTPQAAALRDRFGFPGMRLLQFAFGPGGDYHLSHNHPRNCVAYPGTHDNDTVVGWLAELRAAARRDHAARSRLRHLMRYAGTPRPTHWDVLRLLFLSPANIAVAPVQDILGLDNRARMNLPGTPRGNWGWRLPPAQLTPALSTRLRTVLDTYGRT